MLLDIIIKTGDPLWFKMFFSTALVVVAVLLLSKYFPTIKELLRHILGYFLLAFSAFILIYLILENHCTIQHSLPLQLCSLSSLFSGIVLLIPTQIGYELLMYWAIPGAFHSLLTPELTQGSGEIILFEYYISHGGIILSALFLTFSIGMTVINKSWLNIFPLTQLLIPVIGIVDYFSDANYMYLLQKPKADNILIIGYWPWYILFIEIFMLIHFYIIYFIFIR